MHHKIMREEQQRAADDLATEQAIMRQPEDQRQKTNKDRNAVKDPAIIQVRRGGGGSGAFTGGLLAQGELPAGQIQRDGQQDEVDASHREPAPVIVGGEVDRQGKQQRDQEILEKE